MMGCTNFWHWVATVLTGLLCSLLLLLQLYGSAAKDLQHIVDTFKLL
jgi:hypothetical protein